MRRSVTNNASSANKPSFRLTPKAKKAAVVGGGASLAAGVAVWVVIGLLAVSVAPTAQALDFRAKSSAGVNASTVVLTLPGGVVDDDQMIAVITFRGGSSIAISPPSEWTLLDRVDSTTTMGQALYTKLADGETGPYTWTFTAPVKATGAIVAYRGVDSVSAVDDSSGGANAMSTTITAPEVATSSTNTRLVAFMATASKSLVSTPAGMVSRVDNLQSSGAGGVTVEVADRLLAPAGPSGAVTATSSTSAITIGQLVALKLPTIAFTLAASNAPEETSPHVLSVDLSSTVSVATTVDYAVSGASTATGADYTLASGSLAFAAGETSKSISIDLTDDALNELPETVVVTLANPANANLGTATHTVTIVDNDPEPTIAFTTTTSSGSESTTAPSLGLTLGAVSGRSVTVDYAVTADTADSPADYTLASGTATVPAGSTTVTIPFTVVNDQLDEGDETIEVTLSAPVGATLGANTAHTYTLQDDDTTLAIAATDSAAGEPDNGGTFTITRDGDETSGDLAVNFEVVAEAGSATPGTDYRTLSGTVTIPAEETSATVDVSVLNDAADEPAETVKVHLTPGAGYAVHATDHTATVTIDDNDSTVSIAASQASASEPSTHGQFTITRDEPEGTATVNYEVQPASTAAAGTDYSTLSGTVSFANGDTSKTIAVAVLNDDADEGTETVIVRLASGTDYDVDEALDTATVSIADEDTTVSIAATTPAAEHASNGAFTVTRLESSGELTVNYVVAGTSTATSAVDYAGLSGTVTIPDTQLSATFAVAVIDDDLDEDTETVVVDLAAGANYAIGSSNTATVPIADEDSTVTLSATTQAAEPATDGILTLTRSETVGPLSVAYTVSVTSTAASATDYTALSGTAAFLDGEATATVTVDVIDDQFDEDGETVVVDLAAGTHYALGATTSATVTIADEDSAGLVIVRSDGGNSVAEQDDLGTPDPAFEHIDTFQIKLSSRPLAGQVLVDVLSDDTGEFTVVGEGHYIFDGTTWDTLQPVSVRGVNEDIDDGNQAVDAILDITAVTPEYGLLDDVLEPVTVVDDDTAGVAFTHLDAVSGLLDTSTDVEEGGAIDFYSVVLTSEPLGEVTISAIPVSQVFASPATLTFTAEDWDVPQEIQVSAADDDYAEDLYHTGVIGHASASDNEADVYAGLLVASLTATVKDDEQAGITLGPATDHVTAEDGQSSEFVIFLATAPTHDVTVTFTPSDEARVVSVTAPSPDGGETPGATTVFGPEDVASITFAPDDPVEPWSVTIAGVDDLLYDHTQPWTIVTSALASDDSQYNGLAVDDLTGTNEDDELPGITVTPTEGLETHENGGQATFTVTLDSVPADQVTIPISSSVPTEGTVSVAQLVFPATDAAVTTGFTVTVTGVDDAATDGAIPYTIVLGAATSADGDYDSVDAPDVGVTNNDDEGAGAEVSPTTISVAESGAGNTATFTVRLTAAPSGSVTIPVSIAASDEATADVSSLTFTPSNHGDEQTVTVTGVPDAIDDGAQPFVVVLGAATSTDVDYSGFDAEDVSGTTTNVNHAPTLTDIADEQGEATQDVEFTLDAQASDPDEGDVITYSIDVTPAWASFDPDTGIITGTPGNDDVDEVGVTLTITATDSHGATDSESFLLTVANVNDAPDAVNDEAEANEGSAVRVAVLANDGDIDGDLLAISSVTQGLRGTVTIGLAEDAGTVWYAHDGSESTTDSFTYTISDGNGGTDTATVTVAIIAQNDAPVANPDSATVSEGDAVQVAVVGNDADGEGDTLAITDVTQGTHGAVAILAGDDAGKVSYTHNGGESTTDTFTYTVSDGNGGTATATVTITITPVDDPPVITTIGGVAPGDLGSSTVTTFNEDSVLDLLVTASDPDSASIMFLVGPEPNDPQHGNAAIDGVGGTFSYTPEPGYVGDDQVLIGVTDGTSTAYQAVILHVVNVNDAPVASDDSGQVNEGSSVTVDVLANDEDVDSETLAVESVGDAEHGLVSTVEGGVEYTHDGGESTSDTFTYTVSDGNGDTATATVTISITAVNDGPVANDDSGSVNEAGSVTVDVLANDDDVDSTTLTVESVGDAEHGSVLIVEGGVEYTHDGGESTSDSFTYTITDGALTSTATVAISITAVNDGPVANDDSDGVAEGASVTVDVLANDEDAESGGLTVTSVGDADHGEVSIVEGGVEYAHDGGESTSDSFTYTITDGEFSSTATVTISITPVNDGPVANDDSDGVAEGASVTVDVLANDEDAESDGLTVTSVGDADHGSVSIVEGEVLYAHDGGESTSDSFTYTITDGALTATATVTITVTSLNDPPVAVNDGTFLVDNGGAIDIPVTQLVANDLDAEEDGLTIASVSAVDSQTGQVSLTGATVRFVASATYIGPTQFTYQLCEAAEAGLCADQQASVTLHVGLVAGKPIEELGDEFSIPEDTEAVIPLQGDGPFAFGESPLHGHVIIEGDTARYLPDSNWVGADSFGYLTGEVAGIVRVNVLPEAVPTVAGDAKATCADDEEAIKMDGPSPASQNYICDPSQNGYGADPDQDGFRNVAEWALGSDGNRADSTPSDAGQNPVLNPGFEIGAGQPAIGGQPQRGAVAAWLALTGTGDQLSPADPASIVVHRFDAETSSPALVIDTGYNSGVAVELRQTAGGAEHDYSLRLVQPFNLNGALSVPGQVTGGDFLVIEVKAYTGNPGSAPMASLCVGAFDDQACTNDYVLRLGLNRLPIPASFAGEPLRELSIYTPAGDAEGVIASVVVDNVRIEGATMPAGFDAVAANLALLEQESLASPEGDEPWPLSMVLREADKADKADHVAIAATRDADGLDVSLALLAGPNEAAASLASYTCLIFDEARKLLLTGDAGLADVAEDDPVLLEAHCANGASRVTGHLLVPASDAPLSPACTDALVADLCALAEACSDVIPCGDYMGDHAVDLLDASTCEPDAEPTDPGQPWSALKAVACTLQAGVGELSPDGFTAGFEFPDAFLLPSPEAGVAVGPNEAGDYDVTVTAFSVTDDGAEPYAGTLRLAVETLDLSSTTDGRARVFTSQVISGTDGVFAFTIPGEDLAGAMVPAFNVFVSVTCSEIPCPTSHVFLPKEALLAAGGAEAAPATDALDTGVAQMKLVSPVLFTCGPLDVQGAPPGWTPSACAVAEGRAAVDDLCLLPVISTVGAGSFCFHAVAEDASGEVLQDIVLSGSAADAFGPVDGATCLWSTVDAGATLQDADDCDITVKFTSAGSKVVNLAVTYGDRTADKDVTVTVADAPTLTADAGADQTVAPGTEVELTGTAVSNDGDYTCSWTSVPAADASTATATCEPTFTYNGVGTYVVTLVVTDEASNEDDDTVTITVEEPACLPGADPSFPGCLAPCEGAGCVGMVTDLVEAQCAPDAPLAGQPVCEEGFGTPPCSDVATCEEDVDAVRDAQCATPPLANSPACGPVPPCSDIATCQALVEAVVDAQCAQEPASLLPVCEPDFGTPPCTDLPTCQALVVEQLEMVTDEVESTLPCDDDETTADPTCVALVEGTVNGVTGMVCSVPSPVQGTPACQDPPADCATMGPDCMAYIRDLLPVDGPEDLIEVEPSPTGDGARVTVHVPEAGDVVFVVDGPTCTATVSVFGGAPVPLSSSCPQPPVTVASSALGDDTPWMLDLQAKAPDGSNIVTLQILSEDNVFSVQVLDVPAVTV